jgi:hypothetical protein
VSIGVLRIGQVALIVAAIGIFLWLEIYVSPSNGPNALYKVHLARFGYTSMILSVVSVRAINKLTPKSDALDRERGVYVEKLDDIRLERSMLRGVTGVKLGLFISYWSLCASMGSFLGCIVSIFVHGV